MRPPTKKQIKVLRTLDRMSKEMSFAPTFQELADRLGVHRNAIVCHVNSLSIKGLITKTNFKARAMLVSDAGREFLKERR